MQREINQLKRDPATEPLVARWPALASDVLETAISLQSIPAPTFDEGERAACVLERLQSAGLADTRQTDIHNVYGRTPGADPAAPAVMVSAHLDTVFPAATDLTITRDPKAGRVSGPGLGDNSLGLAALLHLMEAMQAADFMPPVDIWWVATVGEEGLGDLRGIRQAVEDLGERLGAAIILEGLGLGRVYHAGLGVRRLKITASGPGGHSWLHRSRPSAIHALLRLGADLVNGIAISDQPRTSFNIGLIDGGTSINTRAARASLSIDMRSDDAAALARLEADVRRILHAHSDGPSITLETEVVGDRPSARLSTAHGLVEAAQAVLKHLNYGQPITEIGSTDANVPLAAGIPSVCIGITTGGDAHTVQEYVEVPPIAQGMEQVALLTLLACRHVSEWQTWLEG